MTKKAARREELEHLRKKLDLLLEIERTQKALKESESDPVPYQPLRCRGVEPPYIPNLYQPPYVPNQGGTSPHPWSPPGDGPSVETPPAKYYGGCDMCKREIASKGYALCGCTMSNAVRC